MDRIEHTDRDRRGPYNVNRLWNFVIPTKISNTIKTSNVSNTSWSPSRVFCSLVLVLRYRKPILTYIACECAHIHIHRDRDTHAMCMHPRADRSHQKSSVSFVRSFHASIEHSIWRQRQRGSLPFIHSITHSLIHSCVNSIFDL